MVNTNEVQMADRARDLALFNLAIDSKLRRCDVVARPFPLQADRNNALRVVLNAVSIVAKLSRTAHVPSQVAAQLA